jgi:hypothetical protein
VVARPIKALAELSEAGCPDAAIVANSTTCIA